MVLADRRFHTRAPSAGLPLGDTWPRREVSRVRVCGGGRWAGGCFVLPEQSPRLGSVARVMLHCVSPCPALPLYKVNKQYRSTAAIACNLRAFVLVVSGRGSAGGRENLGPQDRWREEEEGVLYSENGSVVNWRIRDGRGI